MEQDFTTPPTEPTTPPPAVLHVDSSGRFFLEQTIKWTKFLAIFGFVMCGLMVIAAFSLGSIMSNMMAMRAEEMPGMGAIGGGMITVFYLLLAVLLFFPNLYLINFANKMQQALASNNQSMITASFRFLRAYFRYIGIFIIIMICFYLLAMLIFIAAAT